MEIKASDVKRLRERTGAGMMECKNALVSCEGDFDKAERLLKEKGLAAVEKRAGRATNEGKVFVKISGNKAVIIELATETDFVARNTEFTKLGESIIDLALKNNYVQPNDELNNLVTDLATKIRENMSLKRLKVLTASDSELLTSYLHGDGRIGVVVCLKSDSAAALNNELVKALAFDLALHVAAFNPLALERTKIDPEFMVEQENIFRKQMEQDEKLTSKPTNVFESILKGKLNKYLSDICLLDQAFVKDEKSSVLQVLTKTSKAVGAQLVIADFIYFRVGE